MQGNWEYEVVFLKKNGVYLRNLVARLINRGSLIQEATG